MLNKKPNGSQTTSQTPKGNHCPECDTKLNLPANTLPHEIIKCPDCGVELEVLRKLYVGEGYLLALAPEVEEDWGE